MSAHIYLATLVSAVILVVPVLPAGANDNPTGKPDRNYNLKTEKPSDVPVRRVRSQADPVIMDVSSYNLTPKEFHMLALKAMLKRGWKIEKNELLRVQGVHVKRNEEFKAIIRLDGTMIIMEFVPGFHTDRDNWLRNLEQDINLELQLRTLSVK